MKYSIIIPVYNVEQYLENCIENLLKQTYKDYEIILVNDGSTDNSVKICEDYSNKYPDVIRLYNITNGGPGAGRNCGIDHARGEYIIFVDSDDELKKEALSQIDKKIEKVHPELLIYDFEEVDEEGNVLYTHDLKTLYESTASIEKSTPGTEKDLEKNFSLSDFPGLLLDSPSCWNKVYKKSIFDNKDIRFPEQVWYEDLRFISKIYSQVDTIAYLDEKLYIYYKRLGSIMNNNNVARNAQIIEAVEDVREFYTNTPYEKEIEYIAIERAYIDASGRILSAKLDRKLLNSIRNYIKKTYPKYKKNPYLVRICGKQKVIYKLMNSHMYLVLRMVFLVNHLLTGKRVKKRKER